MDFPVIKELGNKITETIKRSLPDGCSGVPEFGQTKCCNDHDYDYRIDSGVSRLRGDWRLACCIWKNANKQEKLIKRMELYAVSVGYFIGVRCFGWLFYQKKH